MTSVQPVATKGCRNSSQVEATKVPWKSWVAVDFETASFRGTPCAVGLAEVDDGRIVARHSTLIRPPVFEFWPFNTALHGITPEMCEEAPDWHTILADILAITGGRPLVAHNAGFDIGVIRDACDLCGLAWPNLRYACTLVISRHAWPELPSHSLPYVAGYLGLEEGSHHDPVQDASLAALIGIAAIQNADVATLQELLDQMHVTVGVVDPDTWHGCRGPDRRAPLPVKPSPGAQPGPWHPLYGKSVAFTGALAIPRKDAQQAVVDHGGSVSRGVTKETEILVTGYQDVAKLAVGATRSSKFVKAETLRASGQSIEIITEAELIKLLADVDSGADSGTRLTSS